MIKIKTYFTFAFCLIVFIVVSCQTVEHEANISEITVTLQKDDINIPTYVPQPHNHVVDVTNNWLGEQNATEFDMIEISIEPEMILENVTENQTKTFVAFQICSEICKVVVEETSTTKTYELQAPSFTPTRPFSDFFWESDEVLVFDQWNQPHHGVHYVVNVKTKELLLASPFPDQLPTLAPTGTAEPSVNIYQNGSAKLYATFDSAINSTSFLDLDSGTVSDSDASDIQFVISRGGGGMYFYYLVPSNGAKVGLMGRTEPSSNMCQQSASSFASTSIDVVVSGTYICVVTNQERLARVLIEDTNLPDGSIRLSFITWE